MISLTLLINYKKPWKHLIHIFLNKFLLKVILKISFLILFLFSFNSCSEKMPSLPSAEDQTGLNEFRQLTLTGADISGAIKKVPPRLGNNRLLYLGKNNHFRSYSLINFNLVESLPDILDSLIKVKLTLVTESRLSQQTNVPQLSNCGLWILKGDSAMQWYEDSTHSGNFSLDLLDKHLQQTFRLGAGDTITVTLSNDFITLWQDSTQATLGLLLDMIDPPTDLFQTVYSRESEEEPLLEVVYQDQGDTLTEQLNPSADLSIIEVLQLDSDPEYYYLNEAEESCVLINFTLPDTLDDPNLLIGKARLALQVDTSQTIDYDESLSYYISLMDSTMWYPDFLNTIGSYEAKTTFSPGDTALVFDLENTVQGFISGFRENLGLVIWASNITHDVAILSLYNHNISLDAKKPQLDLLLVKEK